MERRTCVCAGTWLLKGVAQRACVAAQEHLDAELCGIKERLQQAVQQSASLQDQLYGAHVQVRHRLPTQAVLTTLSPTLPEVWHVIIMTSP